MGSDWVTVGIYKCDLYMTTLKNKGNSLTTQLMQVVHKGVNVSVAYKQYLSMILGDGIRSRRKVGIFIQGSIRNTPPYYCLKVSQIYHLYIKYVLLATYTQVCQFASYPYLVGQRHEKCFTTGACHQHIFGPCISKSFPVEFRVASLH